ncbi:hypothetical protein [Kocuria dechangensis]|nr:hypothetical protein [Kocuria dechangensis]
MRKRTTALPATMAAVAALAIGAPAQAAGRAHEDGTGFVGRGAVKAALDWRNRELQANAGTISFVVASESVTRRTWACVNEETGEVREQRMTLTVSLSRSVAHETRTDWKGRVTGFRLTGFDGPGGSSAAPEGPAPNSCPAGPWSLVPESPRLVEGTPESQLMVVHAGKQHALPTG